MQKVLDTARQVAPTDCNIIISGESGTGKELLARYILANSLARRKTLSGSKLRRLYRDPACQ